MRAFCCVAALLSFAASLPAAAAALPDEELPDSLRLNQLQVIGTHNSYHQRPNEPFFSQVIAAYPAAKSWDYSHAPLDKQLDNGVRSFEIDVYALSEDGPFEVLHVPIYDKETSCKHLDECFEVILKWSESHPNHVPISVLIELKDEPMRNVEANVLPFDEARLDRLDTLIRESIPEAKLLTPDKVRGEAETLTQAITDGGWPTLEQCRGQIMIVLHEQEPHRSRYTAGRPSLQGRPMFLRGAEDAPFAAVFIVDDPYEPRLTELVEAGYIVRTRADAGLREGAEGNTQRRDKAFASGAHIISTDFPPGGAHPETGYVVAFPEGNPGRANPATGPKTSAIE